MKKIENNFAVTGFVGKDAEIRQFTTASVARFSLAIGRIEKNGEGNNRVSAFVNAGKKDEQNADPKKAAKKGAKAKGTAQPPQDAPAPDEKDLPF